MKAWYAGYRRKTQESKTMTLDFLTKQFYQEEYLAEWEKYSRAAINNWESDIKYLSTFGLNIEDVKKLLKEPLNFDDWCKAAIRIDKYTKLIEQREKILHRLDNVCSGKLNPDEEMLMNKHSAKIIKLYKRMLKYEIMTLC